MTMPRIGDTTIEHLGPEADQLDLDAYQLAASILKAKYQDAEQWAVDQVWNNGDWVPVALKTIWDNYLSLGVRDMATADAFVARYGKPARPDA